MALSPSPLHGFPLEYLLNELAYVLKTIQLPKELTLQATGNKVFDKDEIKGTPDFTIDMWSSHNTNL